MATKKYRFPITVAVVDPDTSVPEKLDASGRVVQHAVTGVRHVPAGEYVEVTDEEAAKIHALHGTYEEHLARKALEDQFTAARRTLEKAGSR